MSLFLEKNIPKYLGVKGCDSRNLLSNDKKYIIRIYRERGSMSGKMVTIGESG